MHVSSFPLWLTAAFWGFVAGSALLLGALISYFKQVPKKLVAVVMAFGSGVLISALSFELMEEAFQQGGFDAAGIGFLSGAVIYTSANYLLSRRGAKHRKRSGPHQPTEGDKPGSGMAIALGALIDGIPESIAIGLSILHGGAVSMAAVIAIFLSNVPESLSSTAGMKKSGRSGKYIFGLWGGITIISSLAALAGYAIFSHFSPNIVAGVIAVAAGAVLAMLSSTMIPEAYEDAHDLTGMVTVCGFLAAFILSKS